MIVLFERSANKNNQRLIIIFLVSLLGLFFHQSARTSLGNNSIADIILVITFIYLILSRKLFLPRVPILIFLFFSSYIAFVSFFYTPTLFPVESQFKIFFINYIKLLALFLFFILGCNFTKYQLLNCLIRVYSFTAFGISLIGLIGTLLNLPGMNSLMFKYGSRLNGFMNDPNYFAILQVTAIPYFLEISKIKKKYRFIIITFLTLSVILSGSKTGFIILPIYITIKIMEKIFIFSKKTSLKRLIQKLLWVSIVSISFLILIIYINPIIRILNEAFPVTERITILFNSFDSGISSGGSGRDVAWETGIEIIQLSPFFGVGIDHYINISRQYFGVNVIAHNTYLQLAAEWGLPVSILFFFFITILLINITIKYKNNMNLIVQRDIIIIFLLGSMAISLNNARFFWFILGSMLISFIMEKNKNRYTNTLRLDSNKNNY